MRPGLALGLYVSSGEIHPDESIYSQTNIPIEAVAVFRSPTVDCTHGHPKTFWRPCPRPFAAAPGLTKK